MDWLNTNNKSESNECVWGVTDSVGLTASILVSSIMKVNVKPQEIMYNHVLTMHNTATLC